MWLVTSEKSARELMCLFLDYKPSKEGRFFITEITTVPLKWTNRSLKSLNYSLLRAVLRARRFEFVILQF